MVMLSHNLFKVHRTFDHSVKRVASLQEFVQSFDKIVTLLCDVHDNLNLLIKRLELYRRTSEMNVKTVFQLTQHILDRFFELNLLQEALVQQNERLTHLLKSFTQYPFKNRTDRDFIDSFQNDRAIAKMPKFAYSVRQGLIELVLMKKLHTHDQLKKDSVYNSNRIINHVIEFYRGMYLLFNYTSRPIIEVAKNCMSEKIDLDRANGISHGLEESYEYLRAVLHAYHPSFLKEVDLRISDKIMKTFPISLGNIKAIGFEREFEQLLHKITKLGEVMATYNPFGSTGDFVSTEQQQILNELAQFSGVVKRICKNLYDPIDYEELISELSLQDYSEQEIPHIIGELSLMLEIFLSKRRRFLNVYTRFHQVNIGFENQKKPHSFFLNESKFYHVDIQRMKIAIIFLGLMLSQAICRRLFQY